MFSLGLGRCVRKGGGVGTWRWPPEGPRPDDLSAAAYQLPSLFDSGETVSIEAWRRHRSHLLAGLAEHIYGFTPAGGSLAEVTLLSRQPMLGSRATRSEWIMTVDGPRGSLDVPLVVFQPAHPVTLAGSPVFLGMNIV